MCNGVSLPISRTVNKYVFANEREPDNRARNFGEPYNLPNHPVVGVTWYEALAYTRWLTEYAQRAGWLPDGWSVQLRTEPEWEKAARGGLQVPRRAICRPFVQLPTQVAKLATNAPSLLQNRAPGRCYPWGERAEPQRMNFDQTGVKSTNAVGVFANSASPYSVENLSGNVWEWTRSLWGEALSSPAFGYPYQPNDGREHLEADFDVPRVVRGGSFDINDQFVRCAVRRVYFSLGVSRGAPSPPRASANNKPGKPGCQLVWFDYPPRR
jgi:formylglycine-generating enzyme required for sulfatase activity